MKNLSIALLFCLAACSTPLAPIVNPITNTNLYQAELVFDGSVKTFNELKDLCVRRVLPPVCRTYVVRGQGLIRQADAADMAARSFVRDNPTLDAAAVIQAFAGIVSVFGTTVSNLSATRT